MSDMFYAGQQDYIPKLNVLNAAFEAAMSYITGGTTPALPLATTASAGTTNLFARVDHVHPSTAPTPAANDSSTNIATTAFVQAAIAALVASAPATLNTLKELADALGDDPNFATTMTNNLATKAPLASPNFTGTPKAPTPTQGDNSTNIATTAYVFGSTVAAASKLVTARTINGVAFDGTSNITVADSTKEPTIAAGTTAQYYRGDKTWVAFPSNVSYFTNDAGFITSAGNAASATKLQTARNINGVAFDGTTNITVSDSTKEPIIAAGTTAQYWRGDKTWQAFPSNVSYFTNDSGYLTAASNAASATKLATARQINGVAFDGTANITVADSTKLPLAGGNVSGDITMTGNGAMGVPVGTSAQRPTGANGKIRYNSDLSRYEGYNGSSSSWGALGGGATGGNGDAVFYENGQTVNNNYTISTNSNAMTAGPVSIANGVTVQIPAGSVWTIV